MLIQRNIEKEITERLKNYSKAILIYGARQVGKTTLCKNIIKQLPYKSLEINADEQRFIDVLSSRDSRRLNELVGGYDLLFIDEAQRVPDIGLSLKILIDSRPDLKLLITGSSSFELANKTAEPLTGRTWTYTLFPIAQTELKNIRNEFELKEEILERIRWGSYPGIFSLEGEKNKTDYLRGLVANYLYKDVLTIGNIRSPEKIHNLLKLIAFQIGNEVSLNELARQLEISKETIANYIDILEKSFVLFKLTGFSRNSRKEVTKMNKYYFYDPGIRNAVIDNLNPMENRNDHGQLWENFLVLERMKKNIYAANVVTPHFWRVYSGAEIDYIEEGGGKIAGYEFKWTDNKKKKPANWQTTYPEASWELINRDNWLPFAT